MTASPCQTSLPNRFRPAMHQIPKTLSRLWYRAISVCMTGLAQELSIPETEAETEYERLLFEILKRLHQSPQQESIGLLIQWIGSPYEPELKALADHPESDQIRPVAADVRVVLERMTARKDDRALEELEAKFHRGEKLTPEERSQLHELKKQRKQRNHKRTGIYHRH